MAVHTQRKEEKGRPAIDVHTCNLNTQGLRQEDHEFEARRGV